MFRLILNLSLLSALVCFGQRESLSDTLAKIKVTPTFYVIPGKTYVDSVEMNMSKTYLDPHNLKEVKYFKGEDAKIHSGSTKGAILITRKKQNQLISLANLKPDLKTASEKALPTDFVINGVLVDTAAVKIEVTAIKSIKVLKPAKNSELMHRSARNVVLIETKDKKRKKLK
ncbi:hypothetical protein [Flavobacterium sp.]|uniref:hypothetical protein n=1 Tax=Flavobacterium sp. TaxID=239 RepID=UPI00261E0DB0|nr:hypothetical protein [Flavobacterium sp.]